LKNSKCVSLHWNKCFSTGVCRVKNYINVQHFVQIKTYLWLQMLVICWSGDAHAFIYISSESILFDSFKFWDLNKMPINACLSHDPQMHGFLFAWAIYNILMQNRTFLFANMSVFVQIAAQSFNPEFHRLKLKSICLWLVRYMHKIYAVHE